MPNQKKIQIPKEFSRLLDKDWREAAVYGGRFSLKSHTVARILLIRARQEKMRIGCFREFQNSITDSSHQLLSDLIALYELNDFVVTDKAIVNTITGSDFLFKGLRRNEQSVKSIEGIDIAWVEEAQTVSEQSIEILTPTVRKKGSQIIYTYNRLDEEDPVHKRLVLEGRPNTLIINANYDVAIKYDWMPKVMFDEIESDKAHRPALYKTKWLGEPSSQEGRVFDGWVRIEDVPEEAKLERRGLDYGYTNDPTAIVDIYKYNGGYVLNEKLYKKGMSNKAISDALKLFDDILTVADSSEPKSNDELVSYGLPVIGAKKGAGSITQGIQLIQGIPIWITKRSVNLYKEYLNYTWMKDREGKTLNTPEGGLDHALDAVRYAIQSLNPHEQEVIEEYWEEEEPLYSSIGM